MLPSQGPVSILHDQGEEAGLGQALPTTLGIASQVRPRVGTLDVNVLLGFTSHLTSTPQTSCRLSEAWLKTPKCSWLPLRTFFSISAWEVSSLA